jgi:RNA polymerase sigma factor FliA
MQERRVSRQGRKQVADEIRNRIVLDHLTLVKAIAIRVRENLPVHVDVDDLVHAGVLGLFDAVDKYDSGKKVEFRIYAKHRIRGAILDSLREQDWASRDLRKRQKQADAAAHDLGVKLGRTPTEAEIAGAMGLDVEKWRRIQMELRAASIASQPVQKDGERDMLQEFPAAPDMQPDKMCAQKELRGTLERAIKALPERYQKVVFLYYTNDMTMKEIGDILGVNESRVSQIHKTALQKMQVALEAEGISSASVF